MKHYGVVVDTREFDSQASTMKGRTSYLAKHDAKISSPSVDNVPSYVVSSRNELSKKVCTISNIGCQIFNQRTKEDMDESTKYDDAFTMFKECLYLVETFVHKKGHQAVQSNTFDHERTKQQRIDITQLSDIDQLIQFPSRATYDIPVTEYNLSLVLLYNMSLVLRKQRCYKQSLSLLHLILDLLYSEEGAHVNIGHGTHPSFEVCVMYHIAEVTYALNKIISQGEGNVYCNVLSLKTAFMDGLMASLNMARCSRKKGQFVVCPSIVSTIWTRVGGVLLEAGCIIEAERAFQHANREYYEASLLSFAVVECDEAAASAA